MEGIQPEALAGGDTVLHLAAEDPEFGPADTQRLQRSVGAGRRLTVHTYPGDPAGLLNESRPDRYDATATEQVWERIRAMVTASGPTGGGSMTRRDDRIGGARWMRPTTPGRP